MGLDELGQGAALNISLDMDASPKQAQTESGDEWEDVDGDTFPLPGSQSLGSQVSKQPEWLQVCKTGIQETITQLSPCESVDLNTNRQFVLKPTIVMPSITATPSPTVL